MTGRHLSCVSFSTSSLRGDKDTGMLSDSYRSIHKKCMRLPTGGGGVGITGGEGGGRKVEEGSAGQEKAL